MEIIDIPTEIQLLEEYGAWIEGTEHSNPDAASSAFFQVLAK